MRIVSTISTITLGLLVLAGCNKQPAASTPPEPSPSEASRAASVKVAKPERKTLRQAIEQPGHVEAFEQTPIYAKIAGYVRAVNVDIDDRVDEKQVLVELDVPEMVEEAKQKAAAAALAAVEVLQAREALKAAEARQETTKAAQERWQSEYERDEKLVREKVIDEQTREEALNQLKAAAAAHKESAAKVGVANANIDGAQAKQRVAEADQRRAEALLGYAELRSPYPAVVSLRTVHKGHFVQPATGVRGDPLLIVERRDKYRVVVEVPALDTSLVHKGDAFTFRVPDLKGRSFSGKVQRTAWSLDSKTRTLRAEMDWDKPDESVRPGQYIFATITVEHADVWAVPASAVVTKDGQSYCYRVREGKAVRTQVIVGIKSGALVEVTGPEDWKGNDEIVTNPAGLQDGQAVRAETEKE